MAIFLKINSFKRKKEIPTLNILIGLPGAGKTTYAKEYLIDENSVYLSSDDIRIELYGKEIQVDNAKVFQIMNKRCRDALRQGKDVVYDATNIAYKRRKALIKEVQSDGAVNVDAYMICSPIKSILETNLTRTERFIPYDKLVNFIRTIDVPMYYEGFRNIYLINNGLEDDEYSINSFLKKADVYDQGNPNHNETLGGHTRTVLKQVGDTDEVLLGIDFWIIRQAAMYHDFGKMYARTYNEKKEYYNYYNHEKISAYIWYCHEVQHNFIDDKKRYRLKDSGYQVAALIAHHMDFYKKNIDDTKTLFNDDDLFKMLLILNKADKFRK